MWPVTGLPEMPEPTDPIDPRTASEDKVAAWIDGASQFEQATMVQQLSVRGWSCDKALHVRQRVWRGKP